MQNLTVPDDPRVWREALALRDEGFAVEVVCPEGSGRPRRECLDGVWVHRYPAVRERSGLWGQILETVNALAWTAVIVTWIRLRRGIDVLHAANPPDTFFLVGALLRPFGTAFVFDQHDACPEMLEARSGRRPLQGALFRLLEACSYRVASLVVVPNTSYKALALGRGAVPPDRVVVVRNGPDVVVPYRHRPGEAVVCYAGVMGVQDGVETLVDAAAEALRRRPGAFVLELIGRGDDVERLRRRARAAGIEDSVRWTGWVDRAELGERLRSATIAVSPDPPSTYSAISTMTKIGDYLAHGLPTIASDLPENRTTAGDAAVYVAAGEAMSLADEILGLLDDDARRTELARRASERAQCLLWEHSGRRLRQSYRFLLGAAAPVLVDPPL